MAIRSPSQDHSECRSCLHFPEINKISYEGPDSKNPLAFRWYNEDEVVEGKTMKDHFRFSVVYWHTFRGTGADPFGAPTMARPWDDGSETVENAVNRVRVAFEFMEKLGAPFYAFHDRDVAPEGDSLGRNQCQSGCCRKRAEGGTGANRHSVAVGHGEFIQQSSLHARCLDQLQRGCIRVRRIPGQKMHGGDQGAGRPRVCLLGRA